METLIQHQRTGFYRAKRGWTPQREKAIGFATSLQALDYCWKNHLRDVVLVLKFSDPKFDIQLQPFPTAEQKKDVRADLA